MNPESITDKATRSLKWSALMEIVSRTASPIILVVLARLLTPADFGVVATAMIAISFSQMFWDAGLSNALIQTKEAPEDAANVVFWTNIVLGVLIYLLLFFLAPAIALFFKSPASGPVLRVLGLQIVIASCTSVQQALFVRDLDFRGLFWINLFAAFIPGVFSIPLAYYGYGVWALVAGSLAGQVLNCWLLWRRSTWRPKLIYNKVLASKLFSFGFWVLLESFGAWLIVWGDNLIVGRFLGIHDLGVYRTGWMLVTILFGLTLNSFLPVIYPTFSRLQDDLPALKNTFHRINRVVIALALPMGMGLLIVGPEVAALLFGRKWQGLGFVLGVLGLTYSISWLVSLNTEIYRAMGRPDVNTKILWIYLAYFIPVLCFAAQYGLAVFTLMRLSAVLIGVPIQIYFCVKLLKAPVNYLWQEGKPMMLSTMAMAAGISALKWGILPLIDIPHVSISLAILIGAGSLIYLSCLWFFDRNFIREIRSTIKKAALA
jgi:O-antigen/teichoic acid export membrane protein